MNRDSERHSPTYVTDDPASIADDAGRSARGIQSVEVGFRLVRSLEKATGPLPLKALADRSGLSASRARFYLVSFIRLGLISQDPHTGFYDLGPYARHLGLTAIRRMDVVRLSEQPLRRLGEDLREAVFLSVWGNRGPTIVVRIEGPQEVPMSMRVGQVIPVVGSAVGRVFLTHLPRQTTESFIKDDLVLILRERGAETANLLESALESVIAECRVNGYARSQSGLSTGFTTIAAPVFDHAGHIAAVISVVTMGDYPNRRTDEKNLPMLLRTASAVSSALGYAGETAAEGTATDLRPLGTPRT